MSEATTPIPTPTVQDNTAKATAPEIKCDMDGLLKLVASQPKTAIIFTQPNCGKCDPYLDKVKKDLPKDVSLIEIPSGSGACDALQDTFGIEYTPTTLIFNRDTLVDSFVPEGDDQNVNFKRLLDGLAKKAEDVIEAELTVQS